MYIKFKHNQNKVKLFWSS